MNESALLLSLGHNSSAIYTNGTAAIGYEQERLDRVKSSSKPPLKAIYTIEDQCGVPNESVAYVTHWFDKFHKIPEIKYYTGIDRYLSNKDMKVVTHTPVFTHHDAHAWSAHSFFEYWNHELIFTHDQFHYIVADGFGNGQEVISVYKANNQGHPVLIDRIYGYCNSLGLMYQYATDFVGMKMHQDEYKFLGYESHIKQFFTVKEISFINEFRARREKFMLKNSGELKMSDEFINLEDLEYARKSWEYTFSELIALLGIADRTSPKARIAVGYYIQSLLEKTIIRLIDRHQITDLAVAGGIFYNVKLNNAILKEIDGVFSAVPLAGDQGAAIGFYQKYVGQFNWSTLAIGERGFYRENIKALHNPEQHIFVPQSREELLSLMYDKIIGGEVVNLVTNKMEYGPRALGHTSSIFLPTEDLARGNNALNKRNEVMPFAPLILNSNLPNVFPRGQFDRVVGSDQFMIVTYDYNDPPTDNNAGVYHKYPLTKEWSGRPQVITPKNHSILYELMVNMFSIDGIELLTNTSYNYHGEPIVFSVQDIIATHNKQMNNSKEAGVTPNLVLYSIKD
jgi:carbamoyltransferase